MSIATPAHAPLPVVDTRLTRYGEAALATAGLGGAWVVLGERLPIGLPCPMLSLTGIPCPFCGMTRLSELLLQGDVARAISGDPGGVAFVVVLALLALVGIAGRGGFLPRRTPAATPVVLALVASLGIHWTTTLLGGGFVHT